MSPDRSAGTIHGRTDMVRVRVGLLDQRVAACHRLPPGVRRDIDAVRAEIETWAAALPLASRGATAGLDPDLVEWGRGVADGVAAAAIVLMEEALDTAFAALRPFEASTRQW